MGKIIRTNYLINRAFQMRFIFNSLLPILFTQFVIYLTLEYIFFRLKNHGISLGIDPEHTYFKLIAVERIFSLKVFFIISVPLSVTLSFWTLVYSHKIAGPLYKLDKYLENFKENYLSQNKLSFRKNDFFQELPVKINKILEQELKK